MKSPEMADSVSFWGFVINGSVEPYVSPIALLERK